MPPKNYFDPSVVVNSIYNAKIAEVILVSIQFIVR